MENNNSIKARLTSLLQGIGTIFLYLVLTIIGGLLFGDFLNSTNKIVASIAQVGLYLIILLGLGLVYHKRLINDFKNYKEENNKVAIKNWIIGLSIMLISNIIITTFVKDIAANESANRELLMNYPISNILIMVLIAPLIEEITFRASFKNLFKNWFPFSLFTAFLFGLAHIAEFNLLEFLFIIPYGALGFFFAKAFYNTNNIYTSYLAHLIHNGLCVLLVLLG